MKKGGSFVNRLRQWSKCCAGLAVFFRIACFILAGGFCGSTQTVEYYAFTNLDLVIPDGNPAGLADVHMLNSSLSSVSSVRVELLINGEYNGDLYAYLRQTSPGRTNYCVLLNRPGSTASNQYGYNDSGMDVIFDDTATNGDVHDYQIVTNPPAGEPLTGIWQPDGRTNDPDGVLDTDARTTTLGSFAGSGASGQWSLFVADLHSGGTNMLIGWSLEITGTAAPVLTWNPPAPITYGASLGGSQLNATAIYDGTNVSGTFTYSPPAGTVLNSGVDQILSVAFTPSDATSFGGVDTNVTINVFPAPLTISADSQNKVFGQSLAFAGTEFAVSGLVGTDSVSSASLNSAGSPAAAGVAGSPYAITITNAIGTGGLTNYLITYLPGMLTVAKTTASLSVIPYIVTYDGSMHTAGGTATGVFGETLIGLDLSGTAHANAGTYADGWSFTDPTGNYNNATGPVTDLIATATLTVTANNQSRDYGTNNPVLTASYTGFVGGDTTAVLSGEPVLSTTATTNSPAGSYPITVSQGSLSATNYTFSFVDGTLTIEGSGPPDNLPAILTISNQVICPDDALFLTVTASNLNGDPLSFSLDPGAPASAWVTNASACSNGTMTNSSNLNSTNGLFFWAPTRAFASTTNHITLRVTDNTDPSLTTTQTFVVTVLDYLELALVHTNVVGGENVDVPIFLSSSDDVTNFSLGVSLPAGRFANPLFSLMPSILGSSFVQDKITNLLITVQLNPGQFLKTTNLIAQLSLSAITNQQSAFVRLPINSLAANKPDGTAYSNCIAPPGRIAVVTQQPLIDANLSNLDRSLTVYGNIGTNYQVQFSTNPAISGWYPLLDFTQTNEIMNINVDSAEPMIFYRLYQP